MFLSIILLPVGLLALKLLLLLGWERLGLAVAHIPRGRPKLASWTVPGGSETTQKAPRRPKMASRRPKIASRRRKRPPGPCKRAP